VPIVKEENEVQIKINKIPPIAHGAFLERKFDMKERISTCTWDRLGTPPRLKKCDF
jgi:hypothetical protein